MYLSFISDKWQKYKFRMQLNQKKPQGKYMSQNIFKWKWKDIKPFVLNRVQFDAQYVIRFICKFSNQQGLDILPMDVSLKGNICLSIDMWFVSCFSDVNIHIHGLVYDTQHISCYLHRKHGRIIDCNRTFVQKNYYQMKLLQTKIYFYYIRTD